MVIARVLAALALCYVANTAKAQDTADAHLDRGIEFAHQSKFPEAAAEFLRAIALEPKRAEAHYLLGLVRQSWGKWADARTSYQTALRLNPRYPEAQLGLAAVLTRLAEDDAGRDRAVAACLKAIELNPKEAEPHFHLGVLRKQKGDFEAAAVEFETVLRLQPRYPGGTLALADVLVDLRQFDRAVPLLKAVTAAESKNPVAHQLLGSAFAKLGDAPAAVEHLKTALRLGANNPQLHYMLAANLRKLGETEAATLEMRRFNEATAGRESRMQARYHLGHAQKLIEAGKVEEAVAEYQASLSFRQDPDITVDLAVALLRIDRVDEALEILKEVTAKNPKHILGQYHLGLAYARKRKYAEARSAFTRALQLRPDFPEALFGLGMTLALEGQPVEAEKHLRTAIRLRPDQAAPHYYLGVALKQRGETKEAEAEFATARQLDPAFQPQP